LNNIQQKGWFLNNI